MKRLFNWTKWLELDTLEIAGYSYMADYSNVTNSQATWMNRHYNTASKFV